MLESKLNINDTTIDNKNAQVWYCFNCLKEKAAAHLNSWIQNYKNMLLFTVKEFIEQTHKIFSDSEKIQNVLWKLDYMWQENCSLNEFLSEFDQTLLKVQAHINKKSCEFSLNSIPEFKNSFSKVKLQVIYSVQHEFRF